jgi:hypothetical protein
MAREQISLRVLWFPLPIIVPLMIHSLIYHPGLAQWTRLLPKCEGTQFHRASRIKKQERKKERKMQQDLATYL